MKNPSLNQSKFRKFASCVVITTIRISQIKLSCISHETVRSQAVSTVTHIWKDLK